RLLSLIHDAVEKADDAAVRLGRRWLLVDQFELHPERVAGPHWLQPTQLVEAGRAHGGAVKEARVHHEAKAERQRLEAAGDEPAIDALTRRFGIDMEGLRVVDEAEIEDHAFAHRDPARRKALAHGEILEIADHRRRLAQPSAAAMAPPRSDVLALPPRSGVLGAALSASTRAIVASIASAASPSPRCASIIAPDQIWPMGLAMRFP